MGNAQDPARNAPLRDLPSVNEALNRPDLAELADQWGHAVAKHAVRGAIGRARAQVMDGGGAPSTDAIVAEATALVDAVCGRSLKPVINATGVILHTNLGRAPLGRAVIDEITQVALGYSNLEFDLREAHRGDRNTHVREVLKFLTGAEDALVVNNNAAGILLTLNTLARDREVIVSRGELIEIGGSFRIPEIMATSGARLVEVGATNRTRLSDYEKAITDDTAMLLKAHKSNYCIKGFTEEVHVAEMADLAHSRGLPMMYDIGSGLLRKPANLPLEHEPDVAGALADGADIVAFSCDKLLGGPQSGILAGRSEFISRLGRAPLMRTLRVGKLTLAALSAACRHYLRDEDLLASNPAFAMMERSREELERLASLLLAALEQAGVEARKVESVGRTGGGSLPDLEIPSVAVEVLPRNGAGDASQTFVERLFRRLLDSDRPVLGVLREGRLLFDVLTVLDDQVPAIAQAISQAVSSEANS